MFREFGFACPEIPDDRSEGPAVKAGQRCRLLFGFRVDHLSKRGRAAHRFAAKAPDRNDEGDPATREYSPLYDKVTPPTFGANGTFLFALGKHAMWMRPPTGVGQLRNSPSSTPRQRHTPTGRPSASALQPRPASGPSMSWLADHTNRPCFPLRHHAGDQRAPRVFPLQAGHVQAARRRRRQRLRAGRLPRPRAPLARRGHGQLRERVGTRARCRRVPARVDPPSPWRAWKGWAHLLGDAPRARVRPAAPPRHFALPAAGPQDRAQVRQHIVRLASRRCVAQCRRGEVTMGARFPPGPPSPAPPARARTRSPRRRRPARHT